MKTTGRSDAELAQMRPRALKQQSAEERERGAELLARRLDKPFAALGVIFLLVVLGQNTAEDPRLQGVLSAAGWVLWALFLGELLLRAYIAPDQGRFWKKNWWQVIFLLLPTLRILRGLSALRLVRAGRVLRVVRAGGVVSSAIRGSRSTGKLLASRVAWAGALTLITILAASQLLHTQGEYERYSDALHATALATISGEPLGLESALGRVVEILLVTYSVGIFAAVAGTVGAYLLETQQSSRERVEREERTRASTTEPGSPVALGDRRRDEGTVG